jgi:YidC/Oxa1 family membrane protein insertase
VEKRLIAFLILSTVLIFAWTPLMVWLNPPPPPDPTKQQQPLAKAPLAKTPGETPAKKKANAAETDSPAVKEKEKQKPPAVARPPQQWFSLGSVDPQSPYRLLVTMNNRGATIERIELNHPEYRDLEDTSGYLGHLALTQDEGGCRVNVVGAGTPAALAVPRTGSVGPGLKPGDIIVSADTHPIRIPEDLRAYLGEAKPGEEYGPEHGKKPGDTIDLTVRRNVNGQAQELTFTVTLGDRPMQIVQPEWTDPNDPATRNPLSFRMTLESIGKAAIDSKGVEDEIAKLPSLYNETWDARPIPDGVEFTFRLGEDEMRELGQSGALEVVKRYRLAPSTAEGLAGAKGYDLTFEIELRNQGEAPQDVAYRLHGPNGLPLEGWWYVNKVHPGFRAAGARDVIWTRQGYQPRLFTCPSIVKQYADDERERYPRGHGERWGRYAILCGGLNA